MKQSNNPLLYLVLVLGGVVAGLYAGDYFGRKAGYADGLFQGSQEAIEALEATTDSLRQGYREAKELYYTKAAELDSLIQNRIGR